jgi:hypothetical protein
MLVCPAEIPVAAVYAGTNSILIFRPNARAALPSVEIVNEGLEASSSRSYPFHYRAALVFPSILCPASRQRTLR